MKQLLVEKYRPTTTANYVFQDEVTESKVRKWISQQEIPNLLLTGAPGCGKSTLARILMNELGLEPADIKRVNASLTNGIGFIREELEPWMKKVGFGKFKVVLFEEADQLTAAGQKSLRDLIESYSDRVRFIMTANYPKQIIDALHSRFQHIDMKNINMEGIVGLVCDILEAEGIEVTDEEVVMQHIEAYAPDMRKIINSIDEHTDEHKVLHSPSVASSGVDSGAWLQFWSSDESLDPERALELTEAIDMNNYEFFYETMYLNTKKFIDAGLDGGSVVVTISQFLDRAQRAANQRLHLDACLYTIFMEAP